MNRIVLCVVAMSALTLAAFGCGGDDTTAAVTSVGGDLSATVFDLGGAQFPATAAVTVGPNNSLSYAPASVDIAAGGTVTWTWAPGITMPHTVTSGDTPAAFASSPVQMSGTFQVTFPNPGTFHYFCTVHGAAVMSGVVIVH